MTKKEKTKWLKDFNVTNFTFDENDNLTIGGYLDLRGTQITALPDNLTIGGSLYLSGTQITDTKNYKRLSENHIFFWGNSKSKFLKADGMFSEIISKKGNVFTIKNISSKDISYLATDGKFNAHGDTIEKAKADLRFKKIAEKIKNEPIKEDTIITIQYYRTLTGACESGVNSWMKSVFADDKLIEVSAKGIKAKDLLPILKKHSAYGYEKFKSLVTF